MTTLGPNRGLLGNSIGGSTTPQNQLVRVMSAIGRPGWKAILPLEGAVLAGRSINEAKRSGWLGFQERFVEELVVAIIWLFGVKYIANQFDKFHKFDTAVDWSLKKANSVDLTPIERYTQNFAEGQGLLKMKGLRLGVSVGSTLFLLGVVIPWLNQLKTKWIINKFFGKHQPHTGLPLMKSGMNPAQNLKATQPSTKLGAYDSSGAKKRSTLDTEPSPKRFYNPAPPTQQDWTQPNLPFNPSHPVSQSPSHLPQYIQPQYTQPQYYSPSHSPVAGSFPLPYFLSPEGPGNPVNGFNPIFANTTSPQSAYPFIHNPQIQNNKSQYPMAPLQFGGLGSLAKVGHWIENTDYGSILVTDLGITSGRAVVATKRSPFEALEIIFRDGLSMYFYILCVPHISRLLNRIINPLFNRSTLLDPYAAKELDQEILKGALQASKGADAIHFDALKKVILGDPQWEKVFVKGANGKYPEGIEALFEALRTAPITSSGPSGNSFLSLMEKETHAHFPQDPTRASALLQGLQASIQGKQTLHVNETAELLKEIESGSGAFKALNLTSSEQGNLVRVVKQAFRHAVGIDKETLLSLQPFKTLMASLTPEEQAAVQVRIQKMAQKDARDLNNSILRRILNITKGMTPAPASTLAHKLSQGEALAQWMEKSASRSVSLETVVQDEIQDLLTQLANPKTKLPPMNPSQQTALSQLKEILTQQKLSSGSHSFKEVAELLSQGNQKAMAQKISTLETIFMQEGTFSEALQKSINTLLTGLQGEMTLGGPEQKLCAHYQSLMNQLMKSEGKLFSLHTEAHPQTLVEKIEEILVGGLKRDRVFLKEALKTTNILIEDAKSYPHAEKVAEMSHAIGDYLHTFLRRVESHLATQGEKGAVGQVLSLDSLKTIVTKFSEHSKWARMGVQFVAIPAAMLGLGVLIPKLQFLITKVLTGKNEHPGIAAVSHTEGAELYPGNPSENPTAPNFGLHYQPLDRNHFQAFAR